LLERTYAALHVMNARGWTRVLTPQANQRIAPDSDVATRNRGQLDSQMRIRMGIRREIVKLLLEPARDQADRDRRLGELFDRKTLLMRDDIDVLSRSHVPGDIKNVHGVSPHYLQHALERGYVFVDFLRYCRLEFDPELPGLAGERYIPHYLAFVVQPFEPSPNKGVHRIDLGPCEPIDAGVVSWRQAIERGEAAADEAAAVGRLVWDQIAKVLPSDTSTVYISPDGQLGTVPWPALPGRRSGTVLLEDYAVAQVPDGFYLLRHLLLSRTPAQYEALQKRVGKLLPPGVSPTSMSLSDAFELIIRPRRPIDDRAPVLTVGGIHADLPGSAREVARIKRLAGERPVIELLGPTATPDRLVAELPQACYAHIATHGYFAEAALVAEQRQVEKEGKAGPYAPPTVGPGSRYPLAYTGLILAAPTPTSGVSDRVLTSETIPEINLGQRMRLCVLSACRTGLGDVTSGEGVQGLIRAFHLAGCDDVVASLWNVNDAATETLMEEFYRQLWQVKKTPIESLRQAQLDLYRHPERVSHSVDERKAPVDHNATLPVNPSRPKEVTARQSLAARRTAPKWWAAFVLSGAGR